MIPKNKFVGIFSHQGDCHYLVRYEQLTEPQGLIYRCQLWLQDLGNPPQPCKHCVEHDPGWTCIQQEN